MYKQPLHTQSTSAKLNTQSSTHTKTNDLICIEINTLDFFRLSCISLYTYWISLTFDFVGISLGFLLEIVNSSVRKHLIFHTLIVYFGLVYRGHSGFQISHCTCVKPGLVI